MRCKYLWALNQICRLSPAEVDVMGWWDLICFTVAIDDQQADLKKRAKTMSPQPPMQRMF